MSAPNGFSDWLTIIGSVLAVLLAIGWYLSYTAVRLDRLHHRLVGTEAALDAQLVRRAEAAVEAGLGADVDPATATLLVSAAGEALEEPGRWSPERARSETALTEVLRAADDALRSSSVGTAGEPVGQADDEGRELVERLAGAAVRVRFARQFHNDAVRETRELHARRHVRWFRLAGHTDPPELVDFDDDWPAATG